MIVDLTDQNTKEESFIIMKLGLGLCRQEIILKSNTREPIILRVSSIVKEAVVAEATELPLLTITIVVTEMHIDRRGTIVILYTSRKKNTE